MNENIDWKSLPIKGCTSDCIVQGMEYTCMDRFRRHRYSTKYHRIRPSGPYIFALLGTDNQIVELTRDALFPLMQNSQIKVVNLKLSANGSILFDKEYNAEIERNANEFAEFRENVKEAEQMSNETNKSLSSEKNRYELEVRKGMILIVSKTDWYIKYPYNEKIKESLPYHSDGLIISGLSVSDHILEIKKCFAEIQEHMLTKGGHDFYSSFSDTKYEVKYNSEVGKFMLRPYNCKLVVTGEKGVEQWIKDIENCSNKVEEIREELGWKRHKRVIGKLFGAY